MWVLCKIQSNVFIYFLCIYHCSSQDWCRHLEATSLGLEGTWSDCLTEDGQTCILETTLNIDIPFCAPPQTMLGVRNADMIDVSMWVIRECPFYDRILFYFSVDTKNELAQDLVSGLFSFYISLQYSPLLWYGLLRKI